MANEAPIAVCRRCGDPVVPTFKVKFKEWVCVDCQTFYEFLAVDTAEFSPDLYDRYLCLKDSWMGFVAEIDAWHDEGRSWLTHATHALTPPEMFTVKNTDAVTPF